MTLSARSETNLIGVHRTLVSVIRLAAERSAQPFEVVEGRRSLERQIELMAAGKSRIQDPSRGRHVTGHAVDLAVVRDGHAIWDWPAYQALADVVLAAATALHAPLIWGGSWTTLHDGPHFELDRKAFP